MTMLLTNGRGLLAAALDAQRSPRDRMAAIKEANDCRSKAKVGWTKLGAPEGFNLGAFMLELEALVKPTPTAGGDTGTPSEGEKTPSKVAKAEAAKPADGKKAEAAKPADGKKAEAAKPADGKKADKKPKDPNRGGIGRLVNELLTESDLDYATIVERVKTAYPEARTTARSVASVAADLRRDGIEVNTRRRPKKA